MLRLVFTAWLILVSSAQDDFCRRDYDVTLGCVHTYGSVLRTLTNIRSVSECSSQCNENNRCLSIKYDMDKRVCELNSERYNTITTDCQVKLKYAELSKSSCSKVINDVCTLTSDCSVSQSQCFKGKCQCDPGYSYQSNNESCVTSCEEYGSTFTVYSGRLFYGYNIMTASHVDTAEACQQFCSDETAFVCRSGYFLHVVRQCFLSTTTVLGEEGSISLSDNTTHFQRNCQ